MFGGYSAQSRQFLNDTWEYNGSWHQVDVGGVKPAVRGGHAMAYDSKLKQVAMYGGDVEGPNHRTNPGSDLWHFDGAQWIRASSDSAVIGLPRMGYDTDRERIIVTGCPTGGPFQVLEWDGSKWSSG